MLNSEKWYKIDRNNVRFLPVTATYIRKCAQLFVNWFILIDDTHLVYKLNTTQTYAILIT